MEIKINYFLIGKATHCADTFVTAEEREEHGPFYQKRMTEGYFLYCISDLLYGEESAEGVAVECLLFDENVGKFEDLELGKYYMLVTDGNVVLFIKEITEENCLYENDVSLNVEYPKVDKTILEKIML